MLENDELFYMLYGDSRDEQLGSKTYIKLQDTIYLPGLSNRNYRLAIHYKVDDRNDFNPEYYNTLDFNPAIDGTQYNIELKPIKGRVRLKAKEPIEWPNIENLDVLVDDNHWAFSQILNYYDLQIYQWAERTGLALYSMDENSYLETN